MEFTSWGLSWAWWHLLHNGLSVHIVFDSIKILYAELILDFEVLRSFAHLYYVGQYGRLWPHIHLSVFWSIVVIDVLGHRAARVHGVRWHNLYHWLFTVASMLVWVSQGRPALSRNLSFRVPLSAPATSLVVPLHWQFRIHIVTVAYESHAR